jgi:hypothetical protein
MIKYNTIKCWLDDSSVGWKKDFELIYSFFKIISL